MKRCWLLLLFLAVAVPPLLCGCGRQPAAAEPSAKPASLLEVDVLPVHRGNLQTTLDLVGTLLPIRATTVVSDVDGTIASFPLSDRQIQLVELVDEGRTQAVALGLDIGQPVGEGDVLVQIEPTDFQLAVNLAKANLELARRNLDDLVAWKRPEEVESLRAALVEAQSANIRSQSDLQRSRQLIDRKMISQSAHGEAEADSAIAEARLVQAEAALRIAEDGPTEAQLAVARAKADAAEAELKLREEKLRKTTIRAPYDGIISDRYVDVGDRVTAMPRVEILQLIDPRVLFAQVAVPERYQRQIHLDDIAQVTAEGIPAALPARIDLINAKVDPETRTFRVRVTIDNRDGVLKPGGFVNVALPVQSVDDALLVPYDAVTFCDGQPAVFVCDGGRVKKTPVQVGLADHERYEVYGELAPGQQVAVAKTALLADGLRILPKPAGNSTAGDLTPRTTTEPRPSDEPRTSAEPEQQP